MRPGDRPVFEALSDAQAMALTCRGEAGTEFGRFGRRALAAVAWVVRTRAAHPCWWGSGIKGVVFHPAQFSCYCSASAPLDYEGLLAEARDWKGHVARDAVLAACLEVAAGVLAGIEPDPVPGATSYINPKLCDPAWAEGKVFVGTVGHHDFYKDV